MADVTDAEAAPARAELLPCPFCGGIDIRAAMNVVWCKTCEGQSKDFGHTDAREEVIAAWNRRAALTSDDAKDRRIAELEHSLAIKEAMFSVEAEQHVIWMERYLAAEAQLRLSSGTEDGVRGLVEGLEKLRSYNIDIQAGCINYRPEDHIKVADRALAALNHSRRT